MVNFACALCGADVEVHRPSGDKRHFCGTKHKDEYNHNLKLSQAQFDVLEAVYYEVRQLPKSNTVYQLSNENSNRVVALIEHIGGNNYIITETGKYFYNLALDKKQKRV